MASKASLENGLRNTYLSFISQAISQEMEIDALPVSASELAIPCTDAEGNEKFVLIKVSIPRGTRNGEGGYDPYDGYAASEDYLFEKEAKEKEKEAKKKDKERKQKKEKKEEEEE